MKRLELTGQKFGKLTVIKRHLESSRPRSHWECQCDCGRTLVVAGGRLTCGNTRSCGCSRRLDLTGERFGKLTVLGLNRVDAGLTYWDCRCECGKKTITVGTKLSQGKSKSCGCQRGQRLRNLFGQRFGKLTVVSRSFDHSHNEAYWTCHCECGNITSIPASALLHRGRHSCGCQSKTQLIDLTGQRFRELTVLERAANRRGRVLWKCACSCGKVCEVESAPPQERRENLWSS
jgi:hypothetical protein